MTGLSPLVIALCAGIVILAVLRAWQAIRAERGTQRGSAPGTGYHVIDASYHSGGGGGGQSYQFKVPRNPQEYARQFIPRGRK